MQSSNPRRVLPPGVEQEVVFGIMWIRVGTLKLIRPSKQLHCVLVQFWGEETPARLQTRHDLAYNSQKRIQEYQIKAPAIYFVKYLQDMKRNLKLQVEGLGHIVLDMNKFLRKKVQLTDRYVFDHFKGAFEVQGKQNRKMGTLEIEMASNFNPQIAIRQLGEGYQTEQECPCAALHIKDCPCNSGCSCHFDLRKAVDVLAVEKPGLIKDYYDEVKGKEGSLYKSLQQTPDLRIPNSLNSKLREDRDYDANKYLNQAHEPKLLQKMNAERNNRQAKKQQSEVRIVISEGKIQKQQSSSSKSPIDQKFPTVEKILTYEDLRIDNVQKKQTKEIKESLRFMAGNDSEAQSIQQTESKRKAGLCVGKPIINEQKDVLMDQFYSGRAGTFGGRPSNRAESRHEQQEKESPVKRTPEPSYEENLSLNRSLADRVVNLNQQMAKQQQSGPISELPKIQAEQDHRHIKLPKVQKFIHQLAQSRQQVSPIKIKHQNFNRFGRPQSPRVRQDPYPKGMKRSSLPRSSILLNMLVKIYIKTIDLKCEADKFQIIYRPYGQKERVKIGPNFHDPFSILCPISVPQLLKMNQTPFILEFWEFTTSKFLGVIKIDLRKIYKGFTFEGKVNQMAIKTNLVPTTIQEGQTPIQNFQAITVGILHLYAGIGTASQIDTYQNKTSGQQVERTAKISQQAKPVISAVKLVEKDAIEKHGQERRASKEPSLKNLDSFMEFLDQNNKQIFQQIIEKEQSNERCTSFSHFLQSLRSISPRNPQQRRDMAEFGTLQTLFSQTEKSFLLSISDSFDNFRQAKRTAESEFEKNLMNVTRNMAQDTINQIRQISTFNTLSKIKLQEILSKRDQNLSYVKAFIKGLKGNLVNADECIDLLRGKAVQITNVLSKQWIDETMEPYIFKVLFKEGKLSSRAMQMFGEVACPISMCQWRVFLNQCGIQMSIWLALHFFDIAKSHFDESQGRFDQISYITLYNWLILAQKTYGQRNVQQNCNQDQKIEESLGIEKQSQKRKKQNLISESNLANQINENSDQVIENKRQSQIEASPHSPQDNRQVQRVGPSSMKEGQIVEQKNRTFKHTFIIEPLELSVTNAMSGDCVVSYCFHFENEWINSKSLQLFADKHKYPLKMGGKHSFIIHEPVSDYLGDNAVKFSVKVNEKVELVGAVHPDDLIVGRTEISPAKHRNSELNIIPLYGNDTDSMAGKIKYKVTYEVEQTGENVLGKQTTYNLYLPKSGYLNYAIHCKAQHYKIRQQLNIKEEFYIVLVLDLFWESATLKSHFPSVSSRMFSIEEQSLGHKIQLSGGIGLVLNPVILEYIKNKNAKISLNVVYYAKQKGNYERKQLPFATMVIPLIQIIKKNGIQGDYVFKNKLGMFAALATCAFSYDKSLLVLEPYQQDPRPHITQNYWIVLHFEQFINFERASYNSLKCQFVHQGKKYSTEKIALRGQTYHQIADTSILMHLNDQAFQDLKVIPLSLLLGIQKFAVDIDINSLSKNIGNQYFVIVDQTGHIRKMRLGLKVYLFRGTAVLGKFVDAVNRNPNTDVLSRMSLPAEIADHSKMMSLLKKSLRMNSNTFDEAIRELLPRKKDQLPLDFYSNQPYCKLDFTPIFVDNGNFIDNICQDLPTEVSPEQLMDYISTNKIGMTNLRLQFLSRYTFSALNRTGNCAGLDKNINYLGLSNEIDLITFVRKLKVNASESQQIMSRENLKEKQVRITLVQGHNFNYLYNGIKPNVFLIIPQLQYRSRTHNRDAEPKFNQSIRQLLNEKKLPQLRKLKFQAYHEDAPQEILIGEGYLNLNQLLGRNLGSCQTNAQQYQVVLQSAMSKRMRATLKIKIEIGQLQIERSEEGRASDQRLSENLSDSRDFSRIGNIIRGYRNELVEKNDIFESSDDDY